MQSKPTEANGLKKILRIIGRLNVGGPAIHTVLLTDLMNRDKYESHLVTGSEGATEGSMRYLAVERGVPLIEIPEMGREISWKDDVSALWKLIKLIRKMKPDIIHTHTAKAGALGRVASIVALPFHKMQIYHTFHGHIFHSYFSERKTKAFILIEQFLGKFTRQIIAVSDNTGKELLEYRIVDESKLSVIPLGLDLDQFANCKKHEGELRTELDIPRDRVVIGIVARLVPVKGICYFLQSLQILKRKYDNLVVLIVGDGELRAELEAQSVELGLSDIVKFIGYRKDLARIYADLDIVALSSLNEGLPVSIIEAMSSAKVVVSTNVGGVPNLISDGETGFLCPPKDPEAFAKALDNAIIRRESWARIGEKARVSALSRFHITRLVADIDRLYSAHK